MGKGQSLMTEAQYHRAAYGTPEGGERRYPWGSAEPPGSTATSISSAGTRCR